MLPTSKNPNTKIAWRQDFYGWEPVSEDFFTTKRDYRHGPGPL